jgi:hypothetical protein
MIVPTCSPRSAAVSRPGTSPLIICTLSIWRAIAINSRSTRSKGSVPLDLAKSATPASNTKWALEGQQLNSCRA